MFGADIAVTYHSTDETFARLLIDNLTACKLQVSTYQVDSEANDTETDDAKRDEALFQGEKVAVVWSRASANYRNTRTSAIRAQDHGASLIVVQADDCPVPERWSNATVISLAGWQGEPKHPGLKALMSLWPDRIVQTKLGSDRSLIGYPILEKRDSVSVFISHATADKPRIRPLIIELLNSGFSVWIDNPQDLELPPDYYVRVEKTRIEIGKDWQKEIKHAIDTCNWVLCVWSKDAMEGDRQVFHYEVFQALMQNKLHQCIIDPVTPPWPYRFNHHADLRRYNPDNFSVNLQDLIKALAVDR
jgi:hypothetical protein